MAKPFDDLKNKTVAITGGAGVIGHALAHGLASVGMNVAILDLDLEKAQFLADTLSKKYAVKSAGITCDVLKKASIVEARDALINNLGQLDFLINGAGGNSPKASTEIEQVAMDAPDLKGSFFDIQESEFRRTLDLNLMGTVLPSQILGQVLVSQAKGAILNISSMNAYRPLTKYRPIQRVNVPLVISQNGYRCTWPKQAFGSMRSLRDFS